MRDDKTGTDEELNTPDTARTIPTRSEEGNPNLRRRTSGVHPHR